METRPSCPQDQGRARERAKALKEIVLETLVAKAPADQINTPFAENTEDLTMAMTTSTV